MGLQIVPVLVRKLQQVPSEFIEPGAGCVLVRRTKRIGVEAAAEVVSALGVHLHTGWVSNRQGWDAVAQSPQSWSAMFAKLRELADKARVQWIEVLPFGWIDAVEWVDGDGRRVAFSLVADEAATCDEVVAGNGLRDARPRVEIHMDGSMCSYRVGKLQLDSETGELWEEEKTGGVPWRGVVGGDQDLLGAHGELLTRLRAVAERGGVRWGGIEPLLILRRVVVLSADVRQVHATEQVGSASVVLEATEAPLRTGAYRLQLMVYCTSTRSNHASDASEGDYNYRGPTREYCTPTVASSTL
eukprot:gene8708-10329_t